MPGILRIIDTSNSTPIPPYATGRVNKNRLPAADSLSTQSWPPCAPMNSREMLRPSPELPLCSACPGMPANRSKMRRWCSAGMPGPQSSTLTRTISPHGTAWMHSGAPAGEYWMALESRLMSTQVVFSTPPCTAGKVSGRVVLGCRCLSGSCGSTVRLRVNALKRAA